MVEPRDRQDRACRLAVKTPVPPAVDWKQKLLDDAKTKPSGTPITEIRAIIREKPRVITLQEIAREYAKNSVDERADERILRGMQRIEQAYAFAERKFRENAKSRPDKQFRKDGSTPIFAHSTRTAMMAARLGAGSDLIAGLLLHDMIEDCGLMLRDLNGFGNRVVKYVALLTKPKLIKVSNIMAWIPLAAYPRLWEKSEDRYGPSSYQARLHAQFSTILNISPRKVPAEIKVKAFVGKLFDSLDNLVSDQHLRPDKADIRAAVLLLEVRHLEVLAPGLRDIMLELLMERGYSAPMDRKGRWKPKEKVVELEPPEKALDTAYLDRCPAPNGFIAVYSKGLRVGNGPRRENKIRIELPHDAPRESAALMSRFFSRHDILREVEFSDGISLLPLASRAAGRVVIANGIDTPEKLRALRKGLENFHEKLLEYVDGRGTAF